MRKKLFSSIITLFTKRSPIRDTPVQLVTRSFINVKKVRWCSRICSTFINRVSISCSDSTFKDDRFIGTTICLEKELVSYMTAYTNRCVTYRYNSLQGVHIAFFGGKKLINHSLSHNISRLFPLEFYYYLK